MKSPLLTPEQRRSQDVELGSDRGSAALATENAPSSAAIEDPAEDTGRFGNAYCRWTVLYAALIVVIAFSPLLFSICIPQYATVVNAAVLMVFALVWVVIAVNALRNFHRLGTAPLPSLQALQSSQRRTFTHVVIVPCYLDPVEVLFDCLGSLLMQRDPQSLLVVVAFEATTPDLLRKERSVTDAFGSRFGHFLVTVHVVDHRREIAGGCSNKNFALHEAHRFLRQRGLARPGHAVTVTTCDTDSLFHPNYFHVLELMYNAKNPDLLGAPQNCVWQSPLFYNWDLDERPFFNRVTCLLRSMMMLGGLVPFGLNPMSVFSYPLELGLRAGFINPRYGVDDIIAKVRWMCATNEAVPVELLPVPSISGPTIGTSLAHEYDEWARQIRRWIVGSSESFHFFLVHWRGRPLAAGVSWFCLFFCYYAVLLCCAGVNSVLAAAPYPWVAYPSVAVGGLRVSLRSAGLAYLLLQYLVFAVAFYLDAQARRLMTVRERVGWLRNVAHWLLAPPTLLWYSCIALASIVAFTWKGKRMARHDMAAKDGLEGRAADKAAPPARPSRSTSTSVDAAKGDAKRAACALPARFFFGEFSVAVAPAAAAP